MSSSDNNDQNILPAEPGPAAQAAPVASAAPATPSADTRRRALSRWLAAILVVAVVVIVALAATLRHQQQQLDAFGREATRRLDEIVTRADLARDQAKQALTQSQALVGQVARLDERTQKAEDDHRSLAQSYRELVSGNDEATLVDVEQSLMMAAEQLQVAGRIPSAIAALQLAEARLARADRPAFLPAQQAIGRDMNRLQAIPVIDLREVAQRIDGLIAAAGHLPLLAVGAEVEGSQPESAAPAPSAPDAPATDAATPAAEATWWQRVWEPVQHWSQQARDVALDELRELVHVRRVETADALLVAPEQATWLRTNITLRLLEARIALMSRERTLWQADLLAVDQAIRRYADPQAPETTRMLKEIAALRELDPAPRLPDLSESLNAVRDLLTHLQNDAADARTGS